MRTFFVGLFLSVIGVMSVQAQSASDLATPQKRTASLDLIRTLLTTKQAGDSAEEITKKNPFSPKQQAAPVESAAVAPSPSGLGDRELLMSLAEGVNPSGTMQLGGTQILLFGQKKFKVGDVIPIVFQETTHELQVTSIERTSFTLRLKSEEITRPIKPVVNKP